MYVIWLNAPLVGRNLLCGRGWRHLLGIIDEGDHALLVVATGGYSFVGENFVRGAVPDRLTLRQRELPIELRDLDLDDPLKLPPGLQRADAKVFRVIGPAGLDPAQPLAFSLRVTRSKGIVYPERVSRDFPVSYQLASDQLDLPGRDNKSWHGIWRARVGTWRARRGPRAAGSRARTAFLAGGRSTTTVAAASGAIADALTKVMFVAGPQGAFPLARKWNVDVLWVDKAGGWRATPGLNVTAIR